MKRGDIFGWKGRTLTFLYAEKKRPKTAYVTCAELVGLTGPEDDGLVAFTPAQMKEHTVTPYKVCKVCGDHFPPHFNHWCP